MSAAYLRKEGRLRVAALRAAALLYAAAARSSPADARAVQLQLQALNAPLCAAAGADWPAASPPEAFVDGKSARAKVDQLRRLETKLQGELDAMRTRRRQWEARAKSGASARSAARGDESHVLTTLRAELMQLRQKHEQAEVRLRGLKQQRLRVRPKDIQTLDRARSLLESPAALARVKATNESGSSMVEGRCGADVGAVESALHQRPIPHTVRTHTPSMCTH